MFALTELQLDHVVGNGGQPSFGDQLAIPHAVADIGVPGHYAAILVEVTQWTFGPRRGDFELIAGGKWTRLVEEGAKRFADALAVVEGHAFGPVDPNPQCRVTAGAGQGEVIKLIAEEVQRRHDQFSDPVELIRGWRRHH